MLNIGRLGSDAADYYVGEVATSTEDYYSGRGESEGRWVGSLAPRLGLRGTVRPEHFRAVLEGRHPLTGEVLAHGRTHGRRKRPVQNHPGQLGFFDHETLDVPRAASRLGVSTRQVRRLLAMGEVARRCSDATGAARALIGTRVPRPGQRGLTAWAIPRHEFERFEAQRRRGAARPGYDLTLRPPKSVSILWALAPKHQRMVIRDAHAAAVDEVVAYYERHAVHARRTVRRHLRLRIETEGLVAAAFDHRTSRAGDPLLHTHVVTANLSLTVDGRWQAIDGRGIYEHARTAGFLYQAHLRHRLSEELGVEWSPVHNGWAEVVGVPHEVIRTFSKRRDEIEEMVAESGYTSARAHQSATLASRAAKEYGVGPETLQDRWRTEAAAIGFGPPEVAACFGRAAAPSEPDTAVLFDELAGPTGLTHGASSFTRRDVVQAIAERTGAACPAERVDELTDAFLGSSSVVALRPDVERQFDQVWRRGGVAERSDDLARFSTPSLVAAEQQLLSWAREGFGTPVPAASSESIDGVVASHGDLSDEQVEMVQAVCSPSVAAIQVVTGRPGSGKTFATAACVEALVQSGIPVVGCALSATAASELEDASALGPLTGRPASTIARLLIELERQELPPGAVLIVDEASMVGTRDLHRLGEHVARAGGAIKLIGDPDQHGPVETGGLFRRLASADGPDAVRLVVNNRQVRADDRASIEEFRTGLVESALARYDRTGSVRRSSTAARCYAAMVDDWFDAVRAGADDPMIAGPNRVRHALNRHARSRMLSDGRLGEVGLTVGDREFRIGDWVVARRNERRLRTPSGRFVKNGSAGFVAALDLGRGSVLVDFHREGRIELPRRYLEAGWLEHGYARTTYGVQGTTLEHARYFAGDSASFEEGYVALTRGRASTSIYIVDGLAPVADDDAHPAHDLGSTGLETVTQSLDRRRSKELAHDADPAAASVTRAMSGSNLATLAAERRRLESILAAAPPDCSQAIASTSAERDALLARRQAWSRQAAGDRASTSWRPLRRIVSAAERSKARTELTTIARRLEALDGRLHALDAQRAEREHFFEHHRTKVSRLAVVRQAEAALELRVRINARTTVPAEVHRLLGSRPTAAAHRKAWDAAVGEIALYHERHPSIDDGHAGNDASDVEALLGPRPPDVRRRRAYSLAEAAVRRVADVVGDVEPSVEEPLSLP